jgi:hypothetical protein
MKGTIGDISNLTQSGNNDLNESKFKKQKADPAS